MKNFASLGRSLFYLGLLSVSLFGTAFAQTTTGPGINIVDGVGPDIDSCSIVNVSNITTNVTLTGVAYNNLSHTYVSDIQFVIYPPAGDEFILAFPPEGRPCNYAGSYIFRDTGITTIDAITTGCTDNQIIPGGTYRTSSDGGGVGNGTPTSLPGFFGTLTPAQANGEWLVCAFDYADEDTGTVGSTSLTFVGPTAAGTAVGGRVVQPNGNGIRNASVRMLDSQGVERTVVTDGQGNYQFENVPSGLVYVFSVAHLRYQFAEPTQVQFIGEDVSGINFVGTIAARFGDLFTIRNSSSKEPE